MRGLLCDAVSHCHARRLQAAYNTCWIVITCYSFDILRVEADNTRRAVAYGGSVHAGCAASQVSPTLSQVWSPGMRSACPVTTMECSVHPYGVIQFCLISVVRGLADIFVHQCWLCCHKPCQAHINFKALAQLHSTAWHARMHSRACAAHCALAPLCLLVRQHLAVAPE